MVFLFCVVEGTTALNPGEFCKAMGQKNPLLKPVKLKTDHSSTSNPQSNAVGRQIFVDHTIDLNRIPNFDLNEKPSEG